MNFIKVHLDSLGPGLVFALGCFGARDFISNTIAGATFGMGMVWVPILAILIRFVLLDASARYVMATGDTVLSGIGSFGRTPVLILFLISLLRRHVSALTKVLLLGIAADMVLPLPIPTPYSVVLWAILSWSISFVVLFWGRYQSAEWISRPVAAIMAISLLLVIVISQPDLKYLGASLFSWSDRTQSNHDQASLIALAVFTAAVGSISNLSYSAYIHEKGWLSLKSLRAQKFDLILSLILMALMIVMIQFAAASILSSRRISVEKIEDIARVYSEILGSPGRILFGVTLWCGAFASSISNGAGQGMMLADAYHRFLFRRENSDLLDTLPSHMPAYRWSILFMFTSPLYVFLTDWTPMGLVFAYSLISLATLPVMIAMLLVLTSSRKRMGGQVNSVLANLVLVFTIFFSIFIAWQGYLELTQSTGT
jgi:Mn2+/Fe2+ NRAMP family transporter